MPHHWQDDTASGYTISTRVPCQDSASIFKQDCSRKETDTALSFFGLHQGNTEQSIGEPDPDLGFPSLWYSALFDAPEPRTSLLQFKKDPQSPSLQNGAASESDLHLSQVPRTSPKPIDRDTTDLSQWHDIASSKDGSHSRVAPLSSTHPISNFQASLSSITPAPEILLVDADLWSKFHEQGNEMIITRSGRCLFPCLRFKAVNLDPTAIYTIYLDFELVDGRRFKFEGGNWKASNAVIRTDGDAGEMAAALAQESYTHPHKYQTGAHWMKDTIFFDKVKLSNSRESAAKSVRRASSVKSAVGNSHHIFHMSSFHQYRPRVHLVQRAAHSDAVASSITYTFQQTTFIAVTHYQNSKVNDLKKGFNPHARGSRGSAGTSVSLPAAIEQEPSRFSLRSKRVKTLKRRYCERDTSESDLNADADVDDAETDQSSDGDEDDLGSDLSTLPEAARTSSSETFEGSPKSLCRLNKDNCALVSISIARGMIEAKRKSEPPQLTKRVQRKVSTTLFDPHPTQSMAAHDLPDLKSFHATLADSTLAGSNADRKQRIHKSGRFDSSSSSAQSSSSASTKRSSRCSAPSFPRTVQVKKPQKVEPEYDIQEKFAQLSASHSVPPAMEHQQHGAQQESVTLPLHHDPPTAPSLSWYQRFVHWDQHSQALSHQAIQRPALPTPPQSSEESESCLILPFAMDKNIDYMMLHRPPQNTPSQALSTSLLETPGNVVQDTRAFDRSEVSPSIGPHSHLPVVTTGTRRAHSQFHIQEGNTSSQVQSNLTTTYTTILESRTLMSTTSDVALLPSSGGSLSAHLQHALRENLRLKAFIRARYGSEAEAEANAVMAMERRQ
ncbi:T-box transcription factor tbx21 [Mortierella alpina]|uniref:T-box transcription factor tbx21 n=1 Tax=Mortierella alpina TaxID=64518 RepID=A0A9P6LX33_MORAP|nr:T-box transcription factor tbx21 [Mortierella alpina]